MNIYLIVVGIISLLFIIIFALIVFLIKNNRLLFKPKKVYSVDKLALRHVAILFLYFILSLLIFAFSFDVHAGMTESGSPDWAKRANRIFINSTAGLAILYVFNLLCLIIYYVKNKRLKRK